MRKRILIINLLIFNFLVFNFLVFNSTAWTPLCPLFAQQNVDERQAQQMIEKIDAAAQQMKTLQCNFVQTKQLKMLGSKMTSKGRMAYQQQQKLRWEYTSPYQYVFIMNGGKVQMRNQSRNDIVDVRQNKAFQQITRIMMNTVTGRCLSDKQNFKVTMSASGNVWTANLVPLKKEMKQMFSTIIIKFDAQQMVATEVTMTEKSGDKTTIKMTDIRKNKAIDGGEFEIKN